MLTEHLWTVYFSSRTGRKTYACLACHKLAAGDTLEDEPEDCHIPLLLEEMPPEAVREEVRWLREEVQRLTARIRYDNGIPDDEPV